uniref:FIST_C domain-containing protein n=1 Tax=Globodera pallida TaxID=36090 RepID=A0A183BQ57_GLOPA
MEGKNALDTLKLKYVDKLDGTEAPRTTAKLGTATHDNGNKSPRRSLQRLFCVALKQPLAGRLLELAMSAKQKQPFCAIPWLHCVEHRGPILVAALGDDVVIEYFNGEDSIHKEAKENVALYQKSAILGKALLFDCITLEEFNREYSEVPFVRPLRNSFVILLTDVEALSTPIPHNSPSEFFAVHRSMVNAVNLALVNGGGVFEETGTTF